MSERLMEVLPVHGGTDDVFLLAYVGLLAVLLIILGIIVYRSEKNGDDDFDRWDRGGLDERSPNAGQHEHTDF